MKFSLHGVENIGDVFHMHHVAVGVEHLNEPAHVRALEFLRQIHVHPDGCDGVLHDMRLVAYLDGKTQAAHAHLVNAQFPVIALVLLVLHSGRRAVFQPRDSL